MRHSRKKNKKLQTTLTSADSEYRKRLNAYAFSRCRNRETGEDLVQTTLIKTWLYLIKGGKIDLMRAFLYHVLNDLIVDEYRKHKTVSLDVLTENGFEPTTDESDRFLNLLDGKAALLLIQRLPKKYRKVMCMRYLEDLTLREMSVKTKQSKNSIAVQLNRGLGKLRLLANLT